MTHTKESEFQSDSPASREGLESVASVEETSSRPRRTSGGGGGSSSPSTAPQTLATGETVLVTTSGEPVASTSPSLRLSSQQRFLAKQKQQRQFIDQSQFRERQKRIISKTKKPTQRETVSRQSLPRSERQREVFLQERQVDVFRPKGTRRDVPVTEVFVVDEFGKAIRKATEKEKKQFRESPKRLQASERKPSVSKSLDESISGASQRLERGIESNPVFSNVRTFVFEGERQRKGFKELPFERKEELKKEREGVNLFAQAILFATPLNLGVTGSVSRVKLIGAEQRIEKGFVQTDILALVNEERLIAARGLSKGEGTFVTGTVSKKTRLGNLKQESEFIGRQISKSRRGIVRQTEDLGVVKVSRDTRVNVQISEGEILISKGPRIINRVITPRGVEIKRPDLIFRDFIGASISRGKRVKKISGSTAAFSTKGDIDVALISGRIKRLQGQSKELFEVPAGPIEFDISRVKGFGLKGLTKRTRQQTAPNILDVKALEETLNIASQSTVSKIPKGLRPVQVSEVKPSQQIEVTQKELPLQKIKPPTQRELIIQSQDVSPLSRVRSRGRSAQAPKQISSLKEISDVVEREVQRSGLRQAPAQAQPSFQRQPSLQRFSRGRGIESPIIKIPTAPPITPPPVFKLLKPKQRKSEATFGVEVRRQGKFIPVASGLSFEKAFSFGRQRVSSTLAATFKLVQQRAGRFKTPSFSLEGFRKGKTPLTFIEKRGRRLSTGTEIEEIQFSKLKFPKIKL